MAYSIEITRPALLQLKKLDHSIRRRVSERIDQLAEDPRPHGVKQLRGEHDSPLFRVRVGDYQVVYEIRDEKLLVLVVRVGHRSDIYD